MIDNSRVAYPIVGIDDVMVALAVEDESATVVPAVVGRPEH